MTLAQSLTRREESILLTAVAALQHAAGHMSAQDVAVAEANLGEVSYRPLTQLLIDAATDLGELLGGPTGENVGMVRGEVHPLRQPG